MCEWWCEDTILCHQSAGQRSRIDLLVSQMPGGFDAMNRFVKSNIAEAAPAFRTKGGSAGFQQKETCWKVQKMREQRLLNNDWQKIGTNITSKQIRTGGFIRKQPWAILSQALRHMNEAFKKAAAGLSHQWYWDGPWDLGFLVGNWVINHKNPNYNNPFASQPTPWPIYVPKPPACLRPQNEPSSTKKYKK